MMSKLWGGWRLGFLVLVVSGCTNQVQDVSANNQPAQSSQPVAVEPVASDSTADVKANDLYTVTQILDGDTIEAFKDGETLKVRLACIDAPESDQMPYGARARARLSDLVPAGVRLNIVDQDRYGRSVAEVHTPSGSFVNLQLVESGDAVVYDEYLANCGSNGDKLISAEQQAQSAGRGVWADTNFVMPWDYRRGVRAFAADPSFEPASNPADVPTPVSTPEPAANPTSNSVPAAANLPSCINSDCDCGDFSNWRQAQDVLESTPGDPHGLDGDGDGIACESL